MGGFLDQVGFLGTKAPVRSDITLILILITVVMFTIGWQLAVHKRYEAHRWVQTSVGNSECYCRIAGDGKRVYCLHTSRYPG